MNNLTIEANESGRDFIVGDIHGCYELLMDELGKVNFDFTKDRLFSVGDLIDRGPDSLKCLKLMDEPWFYCVRGNHEQFLIDSVLGSGDDHLWYYNGGRWAFNEFMQVKRSELKEITERFRDEIPITITLKTQYGNIGICHAEPPSDNWDDTYTMTALDIQTVLWERALVQLDSYKVHNIDLTIHGHSPVKEVHQVGNSIFLDTGAFFTDNLTILRIDNILEESA